jgi:hypothetical protein
MRDSNESAALFILRWLARALSVVSIGLTLLFMFGEAPDPRSLAWKEIIGLLFFPTGFVAGLILGWHREAEGGLTAIACIAGFYLVYGLMFNGSVMQGWWVLIFGIPAFLLLLHDLMTRQLRPIH